MKEKPIDQTIYKLKVTLPDGTVIEGLDAENIRIEIVDDYQPWTKRYFSRLLDLVGSHDYYYLKAYGTRL